MKVRELLKENDYGGRFMRENFVLKSGWNGAIIYRSWLRRNLPNDEMMDMDVTGIEADIHSYGNLGNNYTAHVVLWVNAYNYQHKTINK